MKILEDLLSTLNTDAKVRDIRQRPFQTAVLTRSCGLALTPHFEGPNHHSEPPVSQPGQLLIKDVKALAELAQSQSLHEAAIGMAA
jgi:hypothetical protein